MGGDYWDNTAVVIYEAADQAEAEAIVAARPGGEGLCLPGPGAAFDVHWMTDKFAPRD